ncbi:MAG: HlyD family efflux transporter periplasmic adaptor subunit [Phycisphaerales bacterium]
MTPRKSAIQSDDPRLNAWQNESAGSGDLFARIASAERAHAHPRERAEAFLKAVVECMGALTGTVSFSISGEDFDLDASDTPSGASAWLPTLRSAVLESRSHAHTIARVFGSKTTAPEFAVIACPFDMSGKEPFGAVAILCRCRDAAHAERLQLHLRSASLLAAGMLVRSAQRRHTVEMDDFARVFAKAGQFKSVHEFAYAVTNSAKQRFGCEQVSLGVMRGRQLKLMCISGLDHIKQRSPGVHHIEQAMAECLDAGQPVVEQSRERWEGSDVAAHGMLHQRWRAASAGACVASVPVFAGESIVAVMSLRRVSEEPFDADEIAAVQKLLAPLGSAIPLIANSTRGLHSHAAASVRAASKWLVRPKSITKKLIIGALIGAAVWFTGSSSTYRVTTPGTVIAKREFVVASPLAARVTDVLVTPGQRVEAGHPLARLDTSLLTVQRAQVTSEIHAANVRIADAVSKRDPATAAVARADRDVLRSRLEEIDSRIDDAILRAPSAGIVIAPELSNLKGRLVPEGEPILTIADESSLVIELRVPENRVTDLTGGAELRFASHARPESAGDSILTRISPAAEQRDGRSVFIAETPVPEGQDFLRPGMEGVAIIDAGTHPNWWIAVHRLLDTARLNFWID